MLDHQQEGLTRQYDVIKQYYCINVFLKGLGISKQLSPLFRCSCIISDCAELDAWCYEMEISIVNSSIFI